MVMTYDIHVSEGALTFCFGGVPTTAHGIATFTVGQDTTARTPLEGPAAPAGRTETFGSVHLNIHGNNEVIPKLRRGDRFLLMGTFNKRSGHDVNAWIVQGTISSVNLIQSKFTFEFINGVSTKYTASELNFSQCPPRWA